jgi:ATP adenylyltransferase/5',5'''-P-1,P-4-tetraphosphate phosphorylase II
MSQLPAPLTSLPALENAFAEGLGEMLERHRGLGVYILVLANAAFDAALWARLAAPLAERHAHLAEAMTVSLRRGGRLDEPDDDVMVFLKLLAIGFTNLQPTQSRRAGPWTLSFNPIRALRPPRMSGATIDRLLRPFDPVGFHFNKPFLAREVFWEGELAGKAARLLYNKFPFARLHGLLVPEPARELPQYLTPELHGWAWEVCSLAGAAVPGFGLAYNSYGAHASVNHLHFQSFVQEIPLPLQDAAFVDNGGEMAYPLPCRRFADAEEAWFHLDELHQQEMPYNLIYTPDCLYVLARAAQGSRAAASWNGGFAWSELAGAITLFSRDDFERLSAAEIAAELANLAP